MAPRDGTWIVAIRSGIEPKTKRHYRPVLVKWYRDDEDDPEGWDDGGSIAEVDPTWPLTHWMPLPTPPETGQ